MPSMARGRVAEVFDSNGGRNSNVLKSLEAKAADLAVEIENLQIPAADKEAITERYVGLLRDVRGVIAESPAAV